MRNPVPFYVKSAHCGAESAHSDAESCHSDADYTHSDAKSAHCGAESGHFDADPLSLKLSKVNSYIVALGKFKKSSMRNYSSGALFEKSRYVLIILPKRINNGIVHPDWNGLKVVDKKGHCNLMGRIIV
jgi:hypothetical protein